MIAIITGATGQDGSYLVDLLLSKNYRKVICLVRRSTYLLEHSNLTANSLRNPNLIIYSADLLDSHSINRAFQDVDGNDIIEIYNLAAQSHVGVSFKCPQSTCDTNITGTLNILETIKQMGIIERCKFYQASTSEMFGNVQEVPQTEDTYFYPRSPYGVSKLAAHWMVHNYKESYGLFACCGILFNHESPRRGREFVTQKIVNGAKNIMNGNLKCLEVGNLDAKRDWGHAKDYVYGMWLMLQQPEPDNYVIASGVQYSVRDFINKVFMCHGVVINWTGSGIDEIGTDDKTGKVIVKVSPEFFRPSEVDTLLGNPSKIKSIGWKPRYNIESLIEDMVGI